MSCQIDECSRCMSELLNVIQTQQTMLEEKDKVIMSLLKALKVKDSAAKQALIYAEQLESIIDDYNLPIDEDKSNVCSSGCCRFTEHDKNDIECSCKKCGNFCKHID